MDSRSGTHHRRIKGGYRCITARRCRLLFGTQAESVALVAGYGWAGERERVIRHSAPRVDLVRIVGRATVTALAAGDAGQAVVPVATVGNEAIGRDWPAG